MMILKTIPVFFLLASCASKPCKEPAPPVGVTVPDQKPAVETSMKLDENRVLIAKSDGSKQCEKNGITLEVMERELKNIAVFSRRKESDGLMRITVCGADTGMHNVYEVEKSNLEKTKKQGFKEWKK